ncbi:hypothetical protein LINPERPRIM_LOCUS23344 [Linum perenne]
MDDREDHAYTATLYHAFELLEHD